MQNPPPSGSRLNPPATPAARAAIDDFSPMNNAGVRGGKKGAVRTRLEPPVSLTVAVLPHADGAVLPQRWHRNGRFSDEGVPADPRAGSRSSHGMSVMRPGAGP
jgi:hypothetical protein